MYKRQDAIAIYPMGARDENNTVPLGMTVALLFFKPSSVISFSPWDMNLDLLIDKSFGVIHAIPLFV